MKNKIMATLGVASIALAVSGTASHAFVGAEPGVNMGLATGAPLPEGVFALDNQFYGKRDGNPGHLGLNVAAILWSTPWTFYNTRLEFDLVPSFFHNDSFRYGGGQPGSGGLVQDSITDGRTRFFNNFFAIRLGHDFGSGFSASFTGGIFASNQVFIPHSYALLSPAFSYTGNGFDLTAQFRYVGTFGSKNSFSSTMPNPSLPGFPGGTLPGISDSVTVDYTATKKFGKFEIGVVGYAYTDIENGIDNANATLTGITAKNFGTTGFTKAAAVAIGGLIGYDFGKFTLQGMVTREVAVRGAPEVLWGTGKETRGQVRVIVPLYIAPPPPAPVVARY